jgi:hypothetical protein
MHGAPTSQEPLGPESQYQHGIYIDVHLQYRVPLPGGVQRRSLLYLLLRSSFHVAIIGVGVKPQMTRQARMVLK